MGYRSIFKRAVVSIGVCVLGVGVVSPQPALADDFNPVVYTSGVPLISLNDQLTSNEQAAANLIYQGQTAAGNVLYTLGNLVDESVSNQQINDNGRQAVLKCSHGRYQFTDFNGTMGLRYNCFSLNQVTNWDFRISNNILPIIDGPVHESGLRWTVSGAVRGQNTPHVVGAGYLFHGTMNPTPHLKNVTYTDTFTFPIIIAGTTGTGTITVSGAFTVSNR
jgi:hypothetical protein